EVTAEKISGGTFFGKSFIGQYIMTDSSGDRWVLGENSIRNFLATYASVVNDPAFFPGHRPGGISVQYVASNFDGQSGYTGTIMEFAAPNWDSNHASRPMVRMYHGRSSGGSRYGRVELHRSTYAMNEFTLQDVLRFAAQPVV